MHHLPPTAHHCWTTIIASLSQSSAHLTSDRSEIVRLLFWWRPPHRFPAKTEIWDVYRRTTARPPSDHTGLETINERVVVPSASPLGNNNHIISAKCESGRIVDVTLGWLGSKSRSAEALFLDFSVFGGVFWFAVISTTNRYAQQCHSERTAALGSCEEMILVIRIDNWASWRFFVFDLFLWWAAPTCLSQPRSSILNGLEGSLRPVWLGTNRHLLCVCTADDLFGQNSAI